MGKRIVRLGTLVLIAGLAGAQVFPGPGGGGGGGGGGLPYPGTPGIVKATGPTSTTVAVGADITALVLSLTNCTIASYVYAPETAGCVPGLSTDPTTNTGMVFGPGSNPDTYNIALSNPASASIGLTTKAGRLGAFDFTGVFTLIPIFSTDISNLLQTTTNCNTDTLPVYNPFNNNCVSLSDPVTNTGMVFGPGSSPDTYNPALSSPGTNSFGLTTQGGKFGAFNSAGTFQQLAYQTSGYTIAAGPGQIPTCVSGLKGLVGYFVTDSASSPTYNATLTGGGSTVVPVFCDGSAWRYH
jgi:hypothetical protein